MSLRHLSDNKDVNHGFILCALNRPDGLYHMIGEEEHAIRKNPAAATSAIVSKVFGALR
jgi:hypothetical protein